MTASDEPVAGAVAEREARAACERILASPSFAKAHRMVRLLRFLVEQAIQGNARGTTEYAIGLDVFDRDAASYSPGDDPIVRVQVGRLRERLQAYDTLHGAPGQVRILIPMGSYMPVLSRCPHGPAAQPQPGPAAAAPDDGALVLQPIRFVEGDGAGRAFALGLHEELVSRMVETFGPGRVGEAPAGDADGAPPHPPPRVLVSSIRVDAQRIRASVRLLEVPQNRVRWAQQFDRALRFNIQEQEELAAAICRALREHLDR